MYNNLPALTDSFLWDEKLLSTNYEAISEGALAAALQSYLQAVRAMKGEWHALQDSLLRLWIARHDQLTLYRPGLLSAEQIFLTDALGEVALRLKSSEMAAAVDLLVQNRDMDRLKDVKNGVAQFMRFVRRHFALI
ncbi:hypothetical protein ACSST1_22400 [Pantoea agglomerans]|uniref:hypothetical protein n=1 Tax=Pantoea TaxID=53335 RepID=UPI000A9E74B7|nr:MULTISPECIES: hypothetical protein [Pantoea]